MYCCSVVLRLSLQPCTLTPRVVVLCSTSNGPRLAADLRTDGHSGMLSHTNVSIASSITLTMYYIPWDLLQTTVHDVVHRVECVV